MSDRVVDGLLLHRELLDRLLPCLPPGAERYASFQHIGGFALGDADSNVLNDLEYQLSVLEDDVMRNISHEMWPQGPGQGPSEPPHNEPHAEVHDGALHVWWGDRDAPVLALDPIPVESFLRPA